MKGQLEKEGNYEVFEDTKGNRILLLNKKNYYSIIEGDLGHRLVETSADHKKKKSIQKGNFYLADYRNNPEFRDIPNLYLQNGKKYKNLILPQDQSTGKKTQKEVVITRFRIVDKKRKDLGKLTARGSVSKESSKTPAKEPTSRKPEKSSAKEATSKEVPRSSTKEAAPKKAPKTTTKKTAKKASSKSATNREPVKKQDLSSKSKQELYEMAKKKDISNRSKMSKEELIKSLNK